jgi:hypothetical protein
VPRIRLRIEEERPVTPCRYHDPQAPSAGVGTVPVLRLTTLARIEPVPGSPSRASRTTTALIDTGAWVSVIETQAWEDYERAGLLERLPLLGGTGLSASVGGRASGYQLGRVWVSLHDFGLGRRPEVLPAVPVVAQLLTNRQCSLPYPLVLGLHLGVLDGRRLVRELVPVPPGPRPPNTTTDCGAWYGQEWFLESP